MYERIQDLLRLALMMQGSRLGVSLEQIMASFGVSRRTAERMRDAVLNAFPQAEEAEALDRVKHWRLPASLLSGLLTATTEELQELNLAAERLEAEGLPERAEALRALQAKVLAALRPARLRQIEPDLEALLEAEGYAMRPGPRPTIDFGVVAQLRQAMLSGVTVRARYTGRNTSEASAVELEPHGLLFGSRHYLAAWPAGSEAQTPKLYRLGAISELQVTNRPFSRRETFSLPAFAAQAFGVFQEPASDVTWRFAPEVQADVLEHNFHPTETKRVLEDGGVEVSFRAGGRQEMAWHLFTWGAAVTSIEPPELAAHYRELLQAAMQANSKRDA